MPFQVLCYSENHSIFFNLCVPDFMQNRKIAQILCVNKIRRWSKVTGCNIYISLRKGTTSEPSNLVLVRIKFVYISVMQTNATHSSFCAQNRTNPPKQVITIWESGNSLTARHLQKTRKCLKNSHYITTI